MSKRLLADPSNEHEGSPKRFRGDGLSQEEVEAMSKVEAVCYMDADVLYDMRALIFAQLPLRARLLLGRTCRTLAAQAVAFYQCDVALLNWTPRPVGRVMAVSESVLVESVLSCLRAVPERKFFVYWLYNHSLGTTDTGEDPFHPCVLIAQEEVTQFDDIDRYWESFRKAYVRIDFSPERKLSNPQWMPHIRPLRTHRQIGYSEAFSNPTDMGAYFRQLVSGDVHYFTNFRRHDSGV